jgi:hypothetical protein
MTERQMIRAMKRWGISVINSDGLWWAGQTLDANTRELGTELVSVTLVKNAGSQHVGPDPESAVEDYCNARDLEWDK